MGQTPPNDLRLIPIIRVNEASGWALHRISPNGTREEQLGEWPSWSTAIVGWRLAGNYTRPVPVGLEAWTMVHVDGWCGAEDAGCPHCAEIARLGDRARHEEKLAREFRVNIPIGVGNYFVPDRVAPERARALAAQGASA